MLMIIRSCLKKFDREGVESMKTGRFLDEVKRLRGLELKVETYDEVIVVKNRFNDPVLLIDVDELCNIDTRYNAFRNLNDVDKIELYMLCNRYVMNSVEGRKSTEKWALEHKWMTCGKRAFLNYNKVLNAVTLDTILAHPVVLTLCTMEDWEKYTGRSEDELLKEFYVISENSFKKLIGGKI